MNFVGKFDAALSSDGTGAHSSTYVHVDHVPAHAPADAILVPDAQLLFHGDFKRSGVDLILSNDDREFVLHDYFKGEKRAALASPDGAHLTGDLVKALTGEVQVSQAGGAVVDHQVIGHVTKLEGSATAVRNGVSIILNMGDNVEKGDVVQSGSDSTLGVTFIDGTVFGLSSNARMVLNEMVYDPNGSNNSSLLSLVAGTITFVAGETAKHGDMKIDTPVATMGIRGTAVLVEIDFTVPGQGATPDAKFQVLVEPDGTTGSYILFDKVTLQPIAMVNIAGQQINISNGVVSQSSTPLSPDIQKLITDVFSLKFSDANTNTKTTTAQTDTLNPELFGPTIKLASGATATPVYLNVNSSSSSSPQSNSNAGPDGLQHIDLPPTVAVVNASLHGAGTKGGSAIDTVSGSISFADINAGDTPTVKVTFDLFVLQDANHNNISSTLTAQQLAEIQAVETSLALVPAPGNNNNGSVTWTYNILDEKFDFLAPGETLTLTYLAEVDFNYAALNLAVVKPITITITGEQLPTIATTSGSITELPGTNNATIDHATGTITFTDADTTAHPLVSTHFTSFTYQNASHLDITSSLTAQQEADIAAIENSLTLTPSPSNANNGSVGWSFDVVDSKLAFLGAGETLTLTYTASVNDGHGGVATEPLTVTITGVDNAPTITTTSGSITELPGTDNTTIDHATGTIAFTEAALTDSPLVSAQFSSFTYQNASHINVTSSLTAQQETDIAAIENSLTLTPSPANTNNGSVSWSYDVVNNKLDFLAAGDTLTLTYTATVNDGHGGLATEPLTVTITGTNDQPTIVGESNPPNQNVVVIGSGELTILDQGINTNAMGLPTETFDHQPTGSLSNNGAGFGDFFSAALDATFSGSGNAGVVNGSLTDVTSAPFVGPLPGQADTTNYLSIGGGGAETITFASPENVFGLYWGSVDSFNTIDFYNGTTLVASFTGNDISPLFATGNQASFTSNGYVEFLGLAPFNKVVLESAVNSFEVDNISAGTIHAELAAPVSGTLSVNEANIGDTLTASVTGNATVELNGSTTLPASLDIAALAAASAIKFDSATSNGGTEVLNWTYDPTNPDVDFLKPGDTLTITYDVQVSDGHGSVGDQPLTISIVGTGATAGMSVNSGSILDIGAPSAATVSFANDSGTNGLLVLGAPSSFSGSISGFTGNGTLAGSDQIDLKGINYYSSSFAESYNSASDTLSVSDGTNSTSLHFIGNYQAANFSFVSDGNGGTTVYDPPAAAGTPAEARYGSNDGFVFRAGLGQTMIADFGPAGGDGIEAGHAIFATPFQPPVSLAPNIVEHQSFIADGHGLLSFNNPAPQHLASHDFHLV